MPNTVGHHSHPFHDANTAEILGAVALLSLSGVKAQARLLVTLLELQTSQNYLC